MKEDDKEIWTQSETLTYLDIFDKNRPLFNTHKASFVYSMISENLAKIGIIKNESQCTRKFSNLLRSYRKCLKRSKQTSGHQKFYFFDKMDEIQKSLNDGVITEELTNEAKYIMKQKSLQGIPVDETVIDELSLAPEEEKSFLKTSTWTHHQTLQFFQAYLDLHHQNKNLWDNISSQLQSQQINKNARECSKKWNNLMRSYLNVKKGVNKATKFLYFNEMARIVEDAAKNEEPMTIQVEDEDLLILENYDMSKSLSDTEEDSNQQTPEDFSQIEEDLDASALQFFTDNFMTICKICLKQNENLHSLNDEDLIKKIKDLFHQNAQTQGEASNIDLDVSNLICEECAGNVEQFHRFKEQYEKAQEFLKQFKADYVVLDQDLLDGKEVEDAGFEVIEEIIEFFEENDTTMPNDLSPSNSQSSSPCTTLEQEKPESPLKPLTPSKNPSKVCEICQATVKVKNFKSHQMIHSGERPYVCHTCQKSFRTSSACKIHLITHQKERSFICAVCSKSFICRNSLSKHKLTHSKVLKYECEICSAKFYRQSSFRTHQASHGIGLSHFCEICDKGFLWPTRLSEHMNEHSGLTPLKCKYCKKSFSKQRNLSFHMKSHFKY